MRQVLELEREPEVMSSGDGGLVPPVPPAAVATHTPEPPESEPDPTLIRNGVSLGTLMVVLGYMASQLWQSHFAAPPSLPM